MTAEASTSPSTVRTYARLRVMVREACAEAVPPGKSARTKDARRLSHESCNPNRRNTQQSPLLRERQRRQQQVVPVRQI